MTNDSYRLGCVPFVNARPLVHFLPQTIQVAYSQPSTLPAMLDSGLADAVLVSSIEALQRPGARIADGICIGSEGRAESVRLFSTVPIPEIKRLRFDPASLTSNMLCLILLEELFGVRPELDESEFDAEVLIGDRGMTEQASGRRVLDLGEEWTSWTGLPFVWALWVGQEGLTEELAAQLQTAAAEGLSRVSIVAAEAARRSGWDFVVCFDYLAHVMQYSLGERQWRGFARFRDELVQRGLLPNATLPAKVLETVARI